jgi:hypothetical protein
MTAFATALDALSLLILCGITIAAAATVACWATVRAIEYRAAQTHGPRIVYGPTDPIAADESVAAALGWDDPFTVTRRQIAALETTGEIA